MIPLEMDWFDLFTKLICEVSEQNGRKDDSI